MGSLPDPTLIVGDSDPWRKYYSHQMGQFASLLSLPGYETTFLPDHSIRDFHSSRSFAASNLWQLRKLMNSTCPKVVVASGLISHPLVYLNSRWCLKIARSGGNVTFLSDEVDVCTGPGLGRPLEPTIDRPVGPWELSVADNFDSSIYQDLHDRTLRRGFVAEDFMRTNPSLLTGNVLVVGAGPLAANVTEHALRSSNCNITWIGQLPDMAANSFPESGRYDSLVCDATRVRSWASGFEEDLAAGLDPRGYESLLSAITPQSNRLHILHGKITAVLNDKVAIQPNGSESGYILKNSKTATSYSSRIYVPFDYIVISASSQTTEEERHSAAYLLNSLPRTISGNMTVIEEDGIFVGLEAKNLGLRVLGSASRNRFLLQRAMPSEASDCELMYQKWHDSLCAQARMANYAMGITTGAATIARANRYYSATQPDNCIHTSPTISDPTIVEHRRRSAEPIAPKLYDHNVYSHIPRAYSAD